jgi:hypothetical protein
MLPEGWTRAGETAIASIDGTHTICKVCLSGTWYYSVWQQMGAGWAQRRTRLRSLDDALDVVAGKAVEYA